MLLALRCRPLDCNKLERSPTFGFRGSDGAKQGPRPSPPVDDHETIWLVSTSPFGIDRVRDYMAKERTDLRTCKEVASATCTAVSAIEAVLGVVERQFHDFAVRQRSIGANPLTDQRIEGRGLPEQVQPPTRSVTFATLSTNGGNTPKANVANAVRPSAAWSENGTRMGTRSPSGASSAHMVRSTFR